MAYVLRGFAIGVLAVEIADGFAAFCVVSAALTAIVFITDYLAQKASVVVTPTPTTLTDGSPFGGRS